MLRRVGAKLLDAWFLAAMTVLLIVLFVVIEPEWLTTGTFQVLLSDNAPLAIIAVAMTFSMISGNIDLSPGSMIGLVGVIIGLAGGDGRGVLVGIAAGLALALLVGVISGLLVARAGLNAIVVTLATYIWARGLAVGFSHAGSVDVGSSLVSFMNHYVAGFTFAVPILLIAFVLGWYLLARTRMGRYTYALGGDVAGARRAGVHVTRQTVLVFAFMALMITVAAVVTVSNLGTAQPLAGQGLELDAIVAVVIGGSRLTGGEGSIPRTAIGVLFIAVLNSGLTNLGLSDAYFELWKGVALLSVLAVQIVVRRRVLPALDRAPNLPPAIPVGA
jgi:ribose/xylose/arabinose/galactoside ABC-type transport system permease subunit